MTVKELIGDLSRMVQESEVVVETLQEIPHTWKVVGPVAVVTRTAWDEVRLTVIVNS